LDLGGGTVVHINSGIAGLVAALVIGKSIDSRHKPSTSNNLILSVMGTGMLWVGWFGFNAGSALSAGTSAGFAMLVTNCAAGVAGAVWMLLDFFHKGKISVQGALSGVVAGLVAITPAAGFVDFNASLIIGIASALVCYLSVSYLQTILNYDDALDVFGLHGVGGIVGAVLVGVLANPDIGGAAGLMYGDADRLWAQVLSILVTVLYSGVATFVLLKIIEATIGLRVDKKVEMWGLDLAHHGETLREWDANLARQASQEEEK